MKRLASLALIGFFCSFGCQPEGQSRNRGYDDVSQYGFYGLDRVAKDSFESGNYARARKCAEALKQMTPEFKGDWNYGNAIEDYNIVFGRLALREGRVEEAKECLLAAGDSPGSPQMNSFGPNMSLAHDLLLKGERKVVLQYFKKCAKFWKADFGALQYWTNEVKAGQVPWFGPNLIY